LAIGYNVVEDCGIEPFKTAARSIKANYLSILNFFINRSPNASAESFNAKVKAFKIDLHVRLVQSATNDDHP